MGPVDEQGRDQGTDVVGFADPAERGLRRERRDHLGEALEGVVREPGAGGAGGDGVDPDPAWAELLGHVAGQHGEATLQRAVGGVAGFGCRSQRGVAGRVDDGAAVGQQRQQRLGQEVRSLEQDVHEPVEQLLGGVLEHRHLGDPRVVDQEVERVPVERVAQRRDNRVTERREGVGLADVQWQGDGRAAVGLDARHRVEGARLVVAEGEDHARPAPGDMDGCALPDAGASAGDDCDSHGLTTCPFVERRCAPWYLTLLSEHSEQRKC